ncbi:hypothetical protein N0B31_15060 [Salinirubellus salinus]|uniref:Right-handed parallel beta-helix repeat-containing protein n=1 Tax=Salinirubellus salinus TaxID=1364945 RepID=A0A9E7R246_9EURY|nr:hypothetical protein [Salinirubellus salinus]UWM53453.1 hypothetical protein N0B31_15060 [Salinirubellus salinus]
MSDQLPSRRRVLQLVGAGAVGGFAGCSQTSSTETPSATPRGATDTPTDTPTSAPTDTPTETPTETSSPTPEECTEVGGTVEAGTTFDGCYLVTDTLDVASGTLTITAGSELVFTRGTGMEVRSKGVLVAQGTESDPVTMRGETEDKGYWDGVAIHSRKPANTMQYVELSSAGGSRWDPCCPRATSKAGLNVWDDGIVTVQHCTFAGNARYGLAATSSADLRDFSANTFADNGRAPMATTTDNLDALDTETEYGDGPVDVRARNVSDSGTWRHIGTAYRMYGRPEIVDDAVVTVEAGSVFTFAEDAGIRVASGTLSVEGSEDAPVVMRGTTPVSGFWRGLSIQSKKPDNRLQFLDIAHGGSGNWDPCCPNNSAPANVNVFDDAIASIVNVTFSDSSNYGMLLSSGSELVEFARNTFRNNEEASVWLTANNLGVLDAATSYDGDDDAPVVVRGNDVTEDATWKSLDTNHVVEKNSTITVTGDASVTVDVGADFHFREDAGLLVEDGASLSAIGDPADLIVFEGTTEAAGWWKGIAFTSPSTGNEIAHTTIEDGGSGKWDPCCPNQSRNACINVFDGGYLNLHDSFVVNSENYATWVDGSSTLDRSDNTLMDPAGSA